MKRITATLAIAALITAGCGSSDNGDTTDTNTDPNTEAAPTDSTAENTETETDMPTEALHLTGEIAYAGDVEQTAAGTLTITLADTSLQDVAYTVIAEIIVELPDGGELPIGFELDADTTGLDERGMFSVLAQVRAADGSLLWTTDTNNPVDITQSNIEYGTLTLVSVTG